MSIKVLYLPKNFYTSQKQISGYATVPSEKPKLGKCASLYFIPLETRLASVSLQ